MAKNSNMHDANKNKKISVEEEVKYYEEIIDKNLKEIKNKKGTIPVLWVFCVVSCFILILFILEFSVYFNIPLMLVPIITFITNCIIDNIVDKKEKELEKIKTDMYEGLSDEAKKIYEKNTNIKLDEIINEMKESMYDIQPMLKVSDILDDEYIGYKKIMLSIDKEIIITNDGDVYINNDKPINILKIISVEPIVETASGSNAGKIITGGLLFGGAGAIVGALSKRKDKIISIGLSFLINDFNNPNIEIVKDVNYASDIEKDELISSVNNVISTIRVLKENKQKGEMHNES